MNRVLLGLLLICMFASVPSMAFSQGLSKSQTVAQAAFSATERRLINDWFKTNRFDDDGWYYDDKGKGKFHGRGGRAGKGKGLPPGIAMNLARGKPLPPGIAKKQLPYGLLSQLPPTARGYQRFIVDNDVLLVDTATNVIADIMRGVVLGGRR